MSYPIKPGQLYALNRLMGQFTTSRSERLFVVSQLIGREISSTKELTVREWQRIRNQASPYWEADDWEACREFKTQVTVLVEQYREDVLGQKRLFSD